jgi:hypothetical protein
MECQSASLSLWHAPIYAPWQDFITVRYFRVCWFGEPHLTIGRISSLQLLLGFNSIQILLSQIWDSTNLQGVFIYFRKWMTHLCHQNLGSLFVASYKSLGCSGCIRRATTNYIYSSSSCPSPSQNQSNITTDVQSSNLSCQIHIRGPRSICIFNYL